MSLGRLVLLLTFSVALVVFTRPVRAASNNVSFSIPVQITSPCTGEVGTGALDVLTMVNQTGAKPGTVHVTIHASVHGELTGDLGSVYHLSAEGSGDASALSDVYDVPFHGNANGQGAAPNLRVDGVADVAVGPSGTPIGVGVVSVSATCGG